MGISIQPRSGGAKHQLRVTHALLEKPYIHTFDGEVEARNAGEMLLAMLARGVVPSELQVPVRPAGRRRLGGTHVVDGQRGTNPLVTQVISEYERLAPITASDADLLVPLRDEVPGLRVSGVTFAWVEDYVASLKTAERHLAPSTIRKRVGTLARVLQWHLNRTTPDGERMPANPFKLLPDGYSLYTRPEAAALAKEGLGVKRDTARDVRLPPAQQARVAAALAGERNPDRERALSADAEFTMLYELILDTGLRLREAYRLRVDQLDLNRRFIHVEGTKGHRGVIKPRTVPLKRALTDRLHAYAEGRKGRLFPTLWDGSNEAAALKKTTARLSARFATLFGYAGLDDFTEHDLRHEATCRWFELRDAAGRWVYDDVAICRIMGWQSTDLALRYASLRGEDLAARLPD